MSNAPLTLQQAHAALVSALVRDGTSESDAAAKADKVVALNESVCLHVPGKRGTTWGALRAACYLRARALAARNAVT